jgi:hypothetical protein
MERSAQGVVVHVMTAEQIYAAVTGGAAALDDKTKAVVASRRDDMEALVKEINAELQSMETVKAGA